MIRRAMLTILVCAGMLTGQIFRDPRAAGLAGAYGTVSRGFQCVGWNPANLALQDSLDGQTRISLGYADVRIQNTVLSLADLSYYSGRNLDEPDPYTGEIPKTNLLTLFEGDGFRTEAGASVLLPLISFSRGNMAVTSRIVTVADMILPYDYADLFLNGNQMLKNYDLTMTLRSMSVAVFDYSYAFKVPLGSAGFSVRAFQGLAWYGTDSDSTSAYFLTDTTAIRAGADYVTRLMYGGTGAGLDLGFTTRDFDGWQFSLAVNNLFANIWWNRPVLMQNLAGIDDEDIYQSRKFSYILKEITPMDFFGDSTGTTPEMEEIYATDKQDVEAPEGSVPVRYPSWFRVGLRRQLNPEVIWVSDFSGSFENKFFARDAWMWSNGIEIVRSSVFPVRAGLAWGGKNNKHISFGFSVRKSIFNFDFALALHNGFRLQTAKGIELSLGGYLDF